MAPRHVVPLNQLTTNTRECDLAFLTDDGQISYFNETQSAEPGTFTVPAVIDLEVYKPGVMTEFAWIFFKGDPMSGSTQGHPFEMPFDNSVKWSMDLVKEDDTSTTIRQIMPPTSAGPFWEGGAPFGSNGFYSLTIPRLADSCKYQFIGEMLLRWIPPNDIEKDTIFRLKLTTDEPATTRLSGKLMISDNSTETKRLFHSSKVLQIHGKYDHGVMGVAFLGLVVVALIFWRCLRRPDRVSLK